MSDIENTDFPDPHDETRVAEGNGPDHLRPARRGGRGDEGRSPSSMWHPSVLQLMRENSLVAQRARAEETEIFAQAIEVLCDKLIVRRLRDAGLPVADRDDARDLDDLLVGKGVNDGDQHVLERLEARPRFFGFSFHESLHRLFGHADGRGGVGSVSTSSRASNRRRLIADALGCLALFVILFGALALGWGLS